MTARKAREIFALRVWRMHNSIFRHNEWRCYSWKEEFVGQHRRSGEDAPNRRFDCCVRLTKPKGAQDCTIEFTLRILHSPGRWSESKSLFGAAIHYIYTHNAKKESEVTECSCSLFHNFTEMVSLSNNQDDTNVRARNSQKCKCPKRKSAKNARVRMTKYQAENAWWYTWVSWDDCYFSFKGRLGEWVTVFCRSAISASSHDIMYKLATIFVVILFLVQVGVLGPDADISRTTTWMLWWRRPM